ncbi:unnamed protein product [Chondrus crispus]|uniref:Uncharacterized protein n=1 Tax=Chondrus crispus TaxID=2769 RepID=R7Q630_CHOCR|nr:unnamed protein product [Chondrus crispus]CDF32846.1 unnamed protein product [Chondrus crispus]|eukprot:XP_005712647.1 unnamed protein product [Chondrus crispus]
MHSQYFDFSLTSVCALKFHSKGYLHQPNVTWSVNLDVVAGKNYMRGGLWSEVCTG